MTDEERVPAEGGPADAAGAGEPGGRPVRRRRHRRATGGSPAGPTPAGGSAGRAPDDTDVGWGERPDGDDDERFLREVPPHW